jgi:hypothetical protein
MLGRGLLSLLLRGLRWRVESDGNERDETEVTGAEEVVLWWFII